MKKPLNRLSDKQLLEDIKKYIKYSHEFYTAKVPELKTLGKRLHEEYDLKEFYRVFNRLWYSNKYDEMSLAIYTLQLYREDFDINTWKFLKNKLREIKSWDKIDSIGSEIVGYILLKYSTFEREIRRLSKSKNPWHIRLALMSTFPLIKKGNIKLAMRFVLENLNSKNDHIQKGVGLVLREISRVKPEVAKRFILKNMSMPNRTFMYATEELRDLRRVRSVQKIQNSNISKLMFWR